MNSHLRNGAIGLCISALALYLAARNADLNQMRHLVSQITPTHLVLPLLLQFTAFTFRAIRWHRILTPVAPLSFLNAASVMMVGYFGNNILPARLGEVLRIWVLRRNYNVHLGKGTATVLVERLLDVIMVLSAFGISSLLLPTGSIMGRSGWMMLVIVAPVVAMMLFLAKRDTDAGKLLETRLPGLGGGPVGDLLKGVAAGLAVLRDARQLGSIVGLTLLVWSLDILVATTMLGALGVPATLACGTFVVGVVGLGMMVPAGPGYIGNFQLLVIGALAPFGVPQQTAFSVSVCWHAIGYTWTTLLGLAAFLKEMFSPASGRSGQETP